MERIAKALERIASALEDANRWNHPAAYEQKLKAQQEIAKRFPQYFDDRSEPIV